MRFLMRPRWVVVGAVVVCGSLLGPGLVAQGPTIRLENNEQEKVLEIVLGPFELPSGTRASSEIDPDHRGYGGHGGAVYPPVTILEVPASVYLTGFSFELRDGSGEVLSNEFLHHLNIINPDNRELFLPISQRMLALGSETDAQSMPGFFLGYPVPAGTRMVVTAMLHNPTERSLSGVEVRVMLEYVPAGRPWPLFNVFPFQLDVAFPAGDKSFDLPPGRSTWSYEASPSIGGRLMAITGHLHPHAVDLVFEDVTDGRVIWVGKPVENEDGELTGVTLGRLYRKLGVKLHRDHVYRVSVTYDNPTADTLWGGGMGLVGGVFMQSGGGSWPSADKSNELYVLDRLHYMRAVMGKYDEILAGAGPMR